MKKINFDRPTTFVEMIHIAGCLKQQALLEKDIILLDECIEALFFLREEIEEAKADGIYNTFDWSKQQSKAEEIRLKIIAFYKDGAKH